MTDHLDLFERRILTDALRTATASYWHRRAAQLEWAKPRPGDYRGQATDADLRDQWNRLDAMVQACRARATAAPWDDVRTELATALQEAA